ncbi:MAG: hypothetical protein SO069_10750 [Succinivibrio sp.]|nr:hypothetical protein [Succinivibrio sp.]
MGKTRHIEQRMNQRGIQNYVIDLLVQLGVSDGEKIVLTKKNCQLLSKVFGDLKRKVEKMGEKGGYKLVANANSLITVYRINSYNRSALH